MATYRADGPIQDEIWDKNGVKYEAWVNTSITGNPRYWVDYVTEQTWTWIELLGSDKGPFTTYSPAEVEWNIHVERKTIAEVIVSEDVTITPEDKETFDSLRTPEAKYVFLKETGYLDINYSEIIKDLLFPQDRDAQTLSEEFKPTFTATSYPASRKLPWDEMK